MVRMGTPALAEKVTPGQNRIRRRVIAFEVKKVIERGERGEAPVHCGDGMARAPAVADTGVYTLDGDCVGWFLGPGEKELQVVEVVDAGGGVRAFAPQPLVEPFEFGEHGCASWQ